MRTIMLVTVVVCGFTALGLARDAVASPTEMYWSSDGAGCIPVDTAIQANQYSIGAGAMKMSASYAGTFVVLCPVHRNSGAANQPNTFMITVQDSDFLYYVVADVHARLYKMSLANGATTLLADVQSSFASVQCDGVTPTGPGDYNVCASFTHTFDWENNAYFVYVTMYRQTTSDSAILYSVGLGH